MTDGCPTHVINDDSLQEKCAAKTMAMASSIQALAKTYVVWMEELHNTCSCSLCVMFGVCVRSSYGGIMTLCLRQL